MIPLSYNVRSLMVRKTTTFASAFGIALVVFVFAAAWMLSQGIRKTLVSAGRADNAIVLRKGSDAELASSIEIKNVSLIAAAPGVKVDEAGTPLVSGEVVVVITQDKTGSDGQVSNVQVRGVSELAFRVRPEVHIVEGRAPKPGTDEVAVGKGLVGRFVGMQLGSTFELKKNRPVNVVGIFEADGTCFESEVWADVNTVRTAFGRDGLVSSVIVKLSSPTKFDGFRATMESDKQLGLEAIVETKYYEKQSQDTSLFVRVLGLIISGFFSLGAMIGAAITMHAAVAQRQREIGTLRALGFSRGSILASFLLESSVLAFAGGAVGIGAALCLSWYKISMLNFATWQEIVFTFDPTPSVLIGSLVFGAGMGVVGGFLPALRAARVSPVEAMRAG